MRFWRQMHADNDRIMREWPDRHSTTSAIIGSLADDAVFLSNIYKPGSHTWAFLPYSVCLHHIFQILIVFKEYIDNARESDPCYFMLNVWSDCTLTRPERSAVYDISTKLIPAHSIFCLENISLYSSTQH